MKVLQVLFTTRGSFSFNLRAAGCVCGGILHPNSVCLGMSTHMPLWSPASLPKDKNPLLNPSMFADVKIQSIGAGLERLYVFGVLS